MDAAYMVSMFTIAWDIIEILALVSTAVKALAVCGVAGFIGSIVIIAVSAAVIVYSIQSAINLYHQMERYRAGDEAAGEEILQDVWLNMVLSIVTIGGTQVTKALINRAVKEKLLKELGEEVLEGAVKKGDNLVKLLSSTHKLKKAGLGTETVADLAKTLSVESLDKLAKLAKKGMPVELLEAFAKNDIVFKKITNISDLLVFKDYPQYADEIVDQLAKKGDEFIDEFLEKGDEIFEEIVGTQKTEPTIPKGSKPKGNYAKGKSDGIKLQNEAANILAENGYDVTMLDDVPQDGNGYGIEPKSNPDFLIDGKVFDCYSPNEGTSIAGICKKIRKKTIEQADRIVMNLKNIPENNINLIKEGILNNTGENGDLKRLKELIVILKDGSIETWFVR